MANIRVKDLPNTDTLVDGDELIVDSSSAGTRRISFGELKSETASDFVAAPSTYKVATLAADNKLDPSQIPDTLTNGLNFVGVANSAPDLVSTTQGDFYVIGTAFGVYSVGDQAVYDGSAYVRVTDGTTQIGEGGTGATTVGTAKTNLQIPDIGTGANEVPLCGFLGSGAFRENDCIVTEHTSVGTDAGGVAVNFYANNTKLYCVKNGPVVSVTGRLMVQTTSATNQLRFTLPYVVGDFGNASGNGFASVGILDSSAGTYTAGYATFEEGNDYVQVRHTPEANDEYYISFTYHTNA